MKQGPIARFHPCRDHAGAEADDAHRELLPRRDLAQRTEDAPVARAGTEVVGRRVAERIAEQLPAVHEAAVAHRAVRHRLRMIRGGHPAAAVAAHYAPTPGGAD